MGLFKPAWQSQNERRALEAIANITDTDKLATIAQTAVSANVRNVAAARKAALQKRRERHDSGAPKNPCPKCGAEMAVVEYYSAIPDDPSATSQEAKRNGNEKKPTTAASTRYTDLQRHFGTICLYCAEKRAFTLLVIGRSMLALGLLVIVAALLAIGAISSAIVFVLVLAGILIVRVGWHFATNGKYCPSSRPDKRVTPSTEDLLRDSGLHDHASERFIQHVSGRQVPQGRVFLSRGLVREMQENGSAR
ncbi:MAG TPA: hypothetical protein P5075_00100 [Eubacteriales bacterium]|nr:hypothetical protein [Eubacteriales bacterium]